VWCNAGEALLDPAITRAVIEAFANKPAVRRELAANLDEVTSREREVFSRVYACYSFPLFVARCRDGCQSGS
jgi:hypothetical protein